MPDKSEVWDQEFSPDQTEVFRRYREEDQNAVRILTRDVFSILNKTAKETVVEIGCGTDGLEDYVPADIQNYVKIDLSQDSLQISSSKDENSHHVRASADALPFEDGSVDGIIGRSSFDVFRHLDEPMEEFEKVLKDDGLVVHQADLTPNHGSSLLSYYEEDLNLPKVENEYGNPAIIDPKHYDHIHSRGLQKTWSDDTLLREFTVRQDIDVFYQLWDYRLKNEIDENDGLELFKTTTPEVQISYRGGRSCERHEALCHYIQKFGRETNPGSRI